MSYEMLPKTRADLRKLSIADLVALNTFFNEPWWSEDTKYKTERIQLLIKQELEDRTRPWIDEVIERPFD